MTDTERIAATKQIIQMVEQMQESAAQATAIDVTLMQSAYNLGKLTKAAS